MHEVVETLVGPSGIGKIAKVGNEPLMVDLRSVQHTCPNVVDVIVVLKSTSESSFLLTKLSN